MMRKDNPIQLEIFSSAENQSGKKNIPKRSLSYILIHEKIILLIIGFLLVGIVSFTLGVNKGKNLASLSVKKQLETLPKMEAGPEGLKEETKVTKEETETKIQPKEEEKAGFTIQVATYRTQSYANREAEKLKKRGLVTLVLTKGEYKQLCVGKFLSRNEAKVVLKNLKPRYQDCFIKRL